MGESLETFYKNLLGIEYPWVVEAIRRDSKQREVTVLVGYAAEEPYRCPVCDMPGKLHDHRKRKWRHLDSCNHKTLIEAAIPRVNCEEHGVRQIAVSWAEQNSRFTSEFEQAVMVWLKDDPVSTVAYNFSLSWDEVDGIMQRAVRRGLERREKSTPEHIGIDETSFQKRHEYVTVILDKDHDAVIDILDDRKAATLKKWFATQEKSDFSQLKSITMDMWDPFINAVRSQFVHAEKLIAFDQFHVASHFAKALNKVRAGEHRELAAASPLVRSKYQWLKNAQRTDNRSTRRREFMNLTRMHLKTARAWRIKEAASMLWHYTYMGVAKKQWEKLLGWISRCRLKPMIAVGRMIRQYFWGILNAIRLRANNSMLEAKNARIQQIKKVACGFRNRERFRNVILFHLGGLDMRPSATQ